MQPKPYPTPPQHWWHARRRYEIVTMGFRTPCWRWLLATESGGYAQASIRWPDGTARHCKAHRLYYERAYGPVPAEMVLDHLCRNRACVNPEHLEVVTTATNVRRTPVVLRGRKLTDEQVAAILASRLANRKIAAVYGISASVVGRLRKQGGYSPEEVAA